MRYVLHEDTVPVRSMYISMLTLCCVYNMYCCS